MSHITLIFWLKVIWLKNKIKFYELNFNIFNSKASNLTRGSKSKLLTKPELGHLRKTGSPPLKHLKEYRVESSSSNPLGSLLSVNLFNIGDKISVTGKTIGKGFAGTVKRHHFTRGPMTHGSKNHREPGSIGMGTTPGRVYPGKRMAGRLGGKQTTIKNLQVVLVNLENNLLVVKGAIPGKLGNLLSIKKIGK